VLAKAKLSDAAAAAKKWRGDAILIQIASRSVQEGGVTAAWDYGFWSSSAKTCAVIKVFPAVAPTVQESGGAICQEPELPTTFIDSDQALKIARANGVTSPTVTMIVSTSAGRGGSRPSGR
jgi:hypothetical protein